MFFPRMPDIMRLRTSGRTTSGMHPTLARGRDLHLAGGDDRRHVLGHSLNHRHDHAVAELLVGLGIADRNLEGLRESPSAARTHEV